jgi:hypothetical protein
VAELRSADIINAVDQSTDERCGLFCGDLALASLPIHVLPPGPGPGVLEVRVDRKSDDREVLAQAVRRIKGRCCYAGDLRETLADPTERQFLRSADIIYAVDGATGQRCAVVYGDPETESVARIPHMPWTMPAVVQVRVNRGTDDLAVLAAAVRDIKGSGR